ncbi:macrophage erythroblast attacher isoform 1 [Coprinopsis cinerea okayama7|uniref:Macrophage erythroblast attacher isoform 1 n=1 Tax=Coprinopsis cinerea (strain Okayama-7 / 130 / ATCC MYA-4618 / FGSC 9003) TaxID=240176 RepID=D6RPQ5_COPC7|nr:macrophage erythroblast attacher isoform 1 [Coprinopsis cinerea okayama7\|eukprot:XP_002910556.1 macrophage erythroblast attacher isoform 1 [Coprinopsis cinerea okayama7\
MANNTKLNVEGILLFEQPFVRVPYENYRKVFRISQKNIERDLGNVQNSAKELVSNAQKGEVDAEAYVTAIDNMISKVENLKQKLNNLQDTAGKPTLDVMRERLNHLATVDSSEPPTSVEFSRWADTRLDRWIVDWCLRTGKERTAKQIAKEKGIETLVDVELFSDIRRIEAALSRHSCTEALAWCSENKAALRKIKSTLEFELRLQEYIELCRARNKTEAIAYIRKYLSSWHETHMSQLNQASGLLAFPPDTKCAPYRRLYDHSRWNSLVRSFRVAIYSLNTIPTEPLLHLALYAGLVALKLPACYDHSTKNVDCPVCDGESGSSTAPLGLGKLAEEVPFSHHSNSTIVCRISGKIMDENNPPMAFPNGRVYSLEALTDMAEKNDGVVICPRTGDRALFRELKKVFI